MLKRICFAIREELWQLEPKGSRSRKESPLTEVNLTHVFSLTITPTHPRGRKEEQKVADRRPHFRQSFSYCHVFGDPALECGAHQGSPVCWTPQISELSHHSWKCRWTRNRPVLTKTEGQFQISSGAEYLQVIHCHKFLKEGKAKGKCVEGQLHYITGWLV